jgi:hypothetical protein
MGSQERANTKRGEKFMANKLFNNFGFTDGETLLDNEEEEEANELNPRQETEENSDQQENR